jgi:cytochrome P450
MISEKKTEILAITEGDANSGVEKRNIQGRDLISILIKANMARDIPDNARMTDEEILSRESGSGNSRWNTDEIEEIPTFLLAGHETTRYLRFFVQLGQTLTYSP